MVNDSGFFIHKKRHRTKTGGVEEVDRREVRKYESAVRRRTSTQGEERSGVG